MHVLLLYICIPVYFLHVIEYTWLHNLARACILKAHKLPSFFFFFSVLRNFVFFFFLGVSIWGENKKE